MSYKIIGDSCSDFTPEMKKDPIYQSIPLTLELGDYSIQDDDNFDQLDFLKRVAASPVGPKTACPSPETFMNAIEEADADEVYLVTLSEHLSGSYQAASIGVQMYEEAHTADRKLVHIFGSDGASATQLNLCLMIDEMKKAGADFDTVVKTVSDFVHQQKTYFVLETLETLRKNGRLSAVSSLIASALNIKPVMSAVNGVIVKLAQERGINKALKKMVGIAIESVGGPEKTKDLRLCICHVNCPERAQFVKEEFLSKAQFRDIVISDTMGVATVYACDGGIVIAL